MKKYLLQIIQVSIFVGCIINKNITELLEQVKRNINYLSIIPLKNNNTIDYEQLKILEKYIVNYFH